MFYSIAFGCDLDQSSHSIRFKVHPSNEDQQLFSCIKDHAERLDSFREVTMTEVRLHKVSETESQTVAGDVVFIHGLGGDHKSTWHPKDEPEAYWPMWLAEDFKQLRVWSLDYPSPATKWTIQGGNMALYDRAIGILDYLVSQEIGKHRILFIVHSLGGLLVKQMLRTADEYHDRKFRNFVSSTAGIVFIATPHSGSNLANLGSALEPILRPTALTKALKANCPHLRELGTWYTENAERLGISTRAFHETMETGPAQVVDATSANPNVKGCLIVPLDGDHFSICKPETKASPLYVGVKSFLLETMGNQSTVGSSKKNIFQPTGVLKTEAPSYIKRQCDAQLAELLEDKKRIVIQGESQIGKSSLLIRVPSMLKQNWQYRIVDFQSLRTDKVERFMNGFYSALNSDWREVTSLWEIADYYRKHPTVLCLDEFGRLNQDIASELIPNLYWITEEVSNNLRIVLCLPQAIDDFLRKLSIKDKNYFDDWCSIEMQPFTNEETRRLLELLPERAKQTAVEEMGSILDLSSYRPKALQSLCYRLWEANYRSSTITFLQIIRDPNSYK